VRGVCVRAMARVGTQRTPIDSLIRSFVARPLATSAIAVAGPRVIILTVERIGFECAAPRVARSARTTRAVDVLTRVISAAATAAPTTSATPAATAAAAPRRADASDGLAAYPVKIAPEWTVVLARRQLTTQQHRVGRRGRDEEEEEGHEAAHLSCFTERGVTPWFFCRIRTRREIGMGVSAQRVSPCFFKTRAETNK
jgi:hypothetical protein